VLFLGLHIIHQVISEPVWLLESNSNLNSLKSSIQVELFKKSTDPVL
jgi:hypothetical protein